MRALDRDKMLQNAQQSPRQTNMAYPLPVNENGHQQRPQRPTIGQFVHTFLDNIKYRFGEESTEVITILNTLGTFRAGEMSKKDTLVAIRLTLVDQADLKQDLLNILFHRDADWAVGDFDFGFPQPLNQPSPSPQFLQPTHQPQMRLPSIFPLWYEDSHDRPPIRSVGEVDSSSNIGFGMPVPSSTHQVLDQLCHPSAFTSPVLTGSASLGTYMRENYEADGNPARRQYQVETVPHLGRIQHEREQTDHVEEPRAYCSQPWSPVASSSMVDRVQSSANNQLDSPALLHETRLSPNVSPTKGQIATASPSVLGVPVAVPIGQPIDEMPPPSKKRRCRQSSKPQAKVEEEPRSKDIETASPTFPSTEIADQVSAPPQPKKEQYTTSQGAGGPYIHSLCGKGFSSRSRVKKHHWGNKLDNLETTTGCWAKNNKPSVSWNDHPSCREGIALPRPIKQSPSADLKQREVTQKAPMAPSMVLGSQDLPQASADISYNRRESDQSFEGQGSYHSHRLRARTSFDNLLTAVNFASQIEAPRPQGRIDSIVSHLDAQATAAEHNRQYTTNWRDASDDHDEEDIAYRRQHPYTPHGLGLRGIHVPVNMALPDLDRSYPHTPSSYSFTETHWNNDRNLVFDDTK